MKHNVQLRVPGPTPIPDDILQAMSRQMINHRGPEFVEMMRRVTENLKHVFQTQNDVFVLTGSGTGGMEAAIVNTLSPDDRVLSASNGVFGDRFADIAETFGAKVERLKFDWGKAVEPDAVRQALSKNPDVKAVLLTHNETSTGVTSDLGAICDAIRDLEKLTLVDAISSMGAIDLPTDKWGCDVVITGSQKGWMSPPGLAMVSVSQRAWKANGSARMPRFYWDFAKARKFLDKGQNPWTPCVTALYALDAALIRIMDEGLTKVIARHTRVAGKARTAVKSLGLTLYPDEKYASNAITAVNVPQGVDGKKLLKILREEYNTVLAGGQSRLEGQIFRIGHIGYVDEEDIDIVIKAVKDALPRAKASS